MAGSQARLSTGSSHGRYRTVSKKSAVDESLFGEPLKEVLKRGSTPQNDENRRTPKYGRRSSRGGPQIEKIETISVAETKALTGEGSPILPHANSLILSRRELDHLFDLTKPKEEIMITADDDEFGHYDTKEGSDRARLRLQRQRELEREQQKRGGPRGTVGAASAQEAQEQRDATLARAQRLKQEEWDEVKKMNQMILYAQCVTIRDKQLDEKRRITDERKKIEKQLDTMMDLERVRDLERREHEEEEKKIKQREAALIIQEQIHANERERIRQHELQELEGQLMLDQVRKFNEEEERREKERIVRGKELLQEILDANRLAIEEKRRKKEEELEHDIEIADYLKVMDKKMQEREDNERKEREKKELLTAKLRAQQQKVIDSKAMEDELRAKRAFEEAERQYRAKEKAEAERRARQKHEIIEYSQKQKEVRIHAIAEKAQEEREEFENNVRWSMDQDRLMRDMDDKKRHSSQSHAAELRKQIDENDDRREVNRRGHLLEGAELRSKFETEKQRKEKIKQEKLRIMQEMGVPEKYQAELVKMKIDL